MSNDHKPAGSIGVHVCMRAESNDARSMTLTTPRYLMSDDPVDKETMRAESDKAIDRFYSRHPMATFDDVRRMVEASDFVRHGSMTTDEYLESLYGYLSREDYEDNAEPQRSEPMRSQELVPILPRPRRRFSI